MHKVYTVDDDGTPYEIVGRVRTGTMALSTQAAEGSVGSAEEFWIDDVPATIAIRGHRKLWVVETEAEEDPFAGVFWAGFTGTRTYSRGKSERRGAARRIRVQLLDGNSLLGRRILVGADCKRPAETDVERLTWLLGTAEMVLVADTTYLSSVDPVDMDAVDYTGQSCLSVIDDCAQQSGKNYWVHHVYSGDPSDPVEWAFWYGHDTLTTWASDYGISNTLADAPDEGWYRPHVETDLDRDPTRVVSGIYQTWDGGYEYVQKSSTAERFAPRDASGQGENVKTSAAAIARARRTLNDVDTEQDTIATSILVDAADVNAIVAGHRVPVHMTHLPGYDPDPVYMRVRDRTVRHVTPGKYELALNLLGPEADAPAETDGDVYGILYMAHAPGSGIVWFEQPGDTPPPGHNVRPTVGLLTPLTGDSPNDRWTYYGWRVDGDGTLGRIRFHATTAGVGEGQLVTWAILKNDAAIGSFTEIAAAGDSGYYGSSGEVIVEDVEVADGDVITAYVSCVPPMPYFRVPLGTGQNDEALEIIGGTLA